MANLPEKNITLVDKITSIPSNSNLFLNADGEFRQASVNDVIKSATVVSDTVNNAINDAMQDSIDSHFKQATGSPILLTDSAEGVLADFKAYGRSTQDGTPTPDSPVDIVSVGDGGYFDGELLQGEHSLSKGEYIYKSGYVCNKNKIPCKEGDTVKIITENPMHSWINFYNETNYVSYIYSSAQLKEYEFTIPSGVTHIDFTVGEKASASTTTIANVGKVSVTINGKYALKVKSVGKNLFDISKVPNTIYMTNNQDGTLTITNSYSNNTGKKLSELTELKAGRTYILSFSSTSEHQFIYLTTTSEKWENGKSLTITKDRLNSYVYFYGNTSGTTTISDIQIEESTVATEYEPYKETVSYIQLSEPLRGVGSTSDEVSLTEVTRRFTEVVFDGSDEDWEVNTSYANTFYHTQINFGKLSKRVICDHYININTPNVNDYGFTVGTYLNFKNKDITTLEQWKAWLQANPITVQYELAEPIVETIEPIDIVTYDNVTYLTASDNAEMELEYPTSKVAGIASIGYSKGRKAEYEVELLKAQLLELQTAMVNSL